MSVDSDWYDYVRQELVDLEERSDSLTSDVDANRARLGADLDEDKQDALDDVHRHLREASEEILEARKRLRSLRPRDE